MQKLCWTTVCGASNLQVDTSLYTRSTNRHTHSAFMPPPPPPTTHPPHTCAHACTQAEMGHTRIGTSQVSRGRGHIALHHARFSPRGQGERSWAPSNLQPITSSDNLGVWAPFRLTLHRDCRCKISLFISDLQLCLHKSRHLWSRTVHHCLRLGLPRTPESR